MAKSKHAPALFEVIGKKAEYKAGGKATVSPGNGSGGDPPKAAVSPTPGGGITIGRPTPKKSPPTPQAAHTPREPVPTRQPETVSKRPVPRPIIAPQATIGSQVSGGGTGPQRTFQVRGGRLTVSLNPANSMIAAGCIFVGIFAMFVLGYRSGMRSAPAPAGGAEKQLDAVAQARRRAANPAVLQLGMAGQPAKPSPASKNTTPKPGSRAKKARSNAPVALDNPSPALRASIAGQQIPIKPVIKPEGNSDPRTPGQTYIVIQYFLESAEHDVLAECRHAARYLASKGIGTFILAGKKGYQLVATKGFTYKTQKQECQAYKERIRKLAKDYKPLDRSYMFMGYEVTYNPKR